MTIKTYKEWLADLEDLKEDDIDDSPQAYDDDENDDFDGDFDDHDEDEDVEASEDATDQVHNQGGFTAQTWDGKKFFNLHKIVKQSKSSPTKSDEVFRASNIKPSETAVSTKANHQTAYGKQSGIAAEELQNGSYDLQLIIEADYKGKKYSTYALTHINIKDGKPADTEDEVKLALAKVKGPIRLRYRGPHSRSTSWARYGTGGETHKKDAHGAAVYRNKPPRYKANEELEAFKYLVLNEVTPPGMEDDAKKMKSKFKEQYGENYKKVLYATLWKRYQKESIEPLDELSKQTLASYSQKAGRDILKKRDKNTIIKRSTGLKRAGRKFANEEIEQLQELYGKGALEKIADFHKKHTTIADHKMKAAELEHGEGSDEHEEHFHDMVIHDAGRMHANALIKLRTAAKAHKDAKIGVKAARSEHPWKG